MPWRGVAGAPCSRDAMPALYDRKQPDGSGRSIAAGRAMVHHAGKDGQSFVQHAFNLDSVTEAEREQKRDEFAANVSVVRQQLRQMERCVVSPQGKFIKRWDKVTGCALLFTAFVTPWEVGFLPSGFFEPIAVSAGLFGLNRFVDAVFVCDICVQFLLPFRNAEGLWIYKHRGIASHYCQTWFPIDFVSSIPYDTLFLLVQQLQASGAFGGETDDGDIADSAAEEPGQSGMLRVLKMLRLMKLGRILRASRILKRWEAYIGLSHATMSLIKFLVITFIISHW